MITVELKWGYGHLCANTVAKKIGVELRKNGVSASCYEAGGYAKIDVQSMDTDKLSAIIGERISARLEETGVTAEIQYINGGVFIKATNIDRDILEEKVKDKIQNNDHWIIDSVY